MEAATNCWTKAEAKIAEALANSAAFQSLVGKSNASDAAEKIFGEVLDEPLNEDAYTKVERENLKAYGQVYHATDTPYGTFLDGTNTYWPFGSCVLFFERLVTEEEQNATEPTATAERWFKNRIGTIIDEVCEWLRQNGGPLIRTVEVSDGPGYNPRDHWDSDGVWQGVELTATWGIVAR